MHRIRVVVLTLVAGLSLFSCSDPTAPETSAALSYVAVANGVWQVRTVRVDGSGDSALAGTVATASGTSQFLFHIWSSDSARLAMTDGQTSVRVVNHAGQVTPIPIGTFVCDGITWSPDGSRIAFVARQSGTLKYQAWVMNRDGTGKVPLGPARTYGNGCGNAIAWMPDGDHIVYSGVDTVAGIWRINRDGSGETLISPQRLFDIAVSPDGQRIVGASYPLPSKAVVVVSATTGAELLRFETPSAYAFKFPRWSPDGHQIAGGVADPQFIWDLFVMHDDGTAFTPIDANNANTNSLKGTIEWSPDGQRLAFLKDGAIYVIGANGQNPTRVTADSVAEHSVRWIPAPQ